MSRVNGNCFNEYGRKYSNRLKDGIRSDNINSVIEACNKLKGHGSYNDDIREALPMAQKLGSSVVMIEAVKEHCGYFLSTRHKS